MKKQLTVALGLAVLATPAFATKARLQALGEDVNGSYYVNDNRNIFLNPAHVNTHKDLVTFELGDTTAADTTAAPRAEGGYYRQAGNLVWGVQLGSESNTSSLFRQAAGVNVQEENNLDFFVGGDSGLKWGANLTYSKSAEDEIAPVAGAKQEAMRTRFGVVMGDTQVFAGLNLTNKAESGAAEFKGKLGYRLGATHAWEGYTLFGNWQSLTGEDVTNDGDIKGSTLELGAGRQTRLNDRANLFARLQYTRTTSEVETVDVDTKTSSLPVVVGLETEATSWLTLRASVSQALWSSVDSDGDKDVLRETTTVNAGASLKFGELTVDGVVGNSTAAATGDNTAAGAGTLRTDVLMTRVGMTYRF